MRRTWPFPANRIKSSEFVCKQPTQSLWQKLGTKGYSSFNALLSRNCTVSVLTFSFLFQLIFFRFQCSIWKVDFFRIIPSKFSKSFESLFERKIKWNTDCCKSFSRKKLIDFSQFRWQTTKNLSIFGRLWTNRYLV